MRRSTMAAVAVAILAVFNERAFAQEEEDENSETIHIGSEDIEETTFVPDQASEQMMEERRRQEAFVTHLLTSVSEECNAELQVVLQTPPEQQTKDQLSPKCQQEVSTVAESFRRREGGNQQQQQQQQGEGEEGVEGQAPAPPKPVEDSTAVIAQVLLAVLLPILAFIAIVYKRHSDEQTRLSKMTDAEKAALRQQKLDQERREQKKIAKARRQGKPVKKTEDDGAEM